MNHSKQQGAVLAIGLILLLLMTLLGTMSMSRVSTSERLAGTERDMNSAFQAAEAALLEGERWIDSLSTGVPATVETCDPGSCDLDLAVFAGDTGNGIRGTSSWQNLNWDTVGRTLAVNNVDAELEQIIEQPKYVIEYIGAVAAAAGGEDFLYYRITSRAKGTTAASEIILQSVYRRTF